MKKLVIPIVVIVSMFLSGTAVAQSAYLKTAQINRTANAEAGGATYIIPSVANSPGRNGTYFKTDVSITNPGNSSISLAFLFFPTNTDNNLFFVNYPHQMAGIYLSAKQSMTVSNILDTYFHFQGSGALIVYEPNGNMFLANARTYTVDPSTNGTYGLMETAQFYYVPSMDFDSGNTVYAYLNSLKQTVSFRSNVGIFILWFGAVSEQAFPFRIEVYNNSGQLVGATTVKLSGWGHTQVSLSSFCQNFDGGYAKIYSISPSDALGFEAYGVVNDNISGDGVFINDVGVYYSGSSPTQ